MTPPTPAQMDAALAALTGALTEQKPGSDLERNLLRLRLVAEAKTRGVSWAHIGAALGMSGKTAKAEMKRLARATQWEVLQAKRNG